MGLRENVKSLGKLEGRNIEEFERICGKPAATRLVKYGVSERTWSGIDYSIVLEISLSSNRITRVVRESYDPKGKYMFYGIVAILLIITVVFAVYSGGTSKSNKPSYHDLTPQEQENAKWAYEAQQAINEIEGNN